MTILEFHSEHRVRKGLNYSPFKNDRILLGCCQRILLLILN